MSGKIHPAPWTDAEINILRQHYPAGGIRAVRPLLNRTDAAIRDKRQKLGISSKKNHGCFEDGQPPWNKGRKGYTPGGRNAETQFKQGRKPHNWVPIGAERLSKGGYLQRKMTDTGYPPRDWVFVHHLLWIEHNGPIPKGHIVVFRNGDKTDIRLENLELISRRELMGRNSVHKLHPALKPVVFAKARLTRVIRRLEREEQN